MTSCREIVRAAYEEIGALVGSEPDARDGELGMRRLNALIAGLAGMGIGEPLRDVEIRGDSELRANGRAVAVAGGLSLTLPCAPPDGARVMRKGRQESQEGGPHGESSSCIITTSSQRPRLKPTLSSEPIGLKPSALCTPIEPPFRLSPITATSCL